MSHQSKYMLAAIMGLSALTYRNATDDIANVEGQSAAPDAAAPPPVTASEAANSLMISPNFDKFHDEKVFKFHFKKDDLGNKRPTVELSLKVPSVEGIVDILTKEGNEKELELLRDAINDYVEAQARAIVNEQEDISQENFPMEKVLWPYIANLPKAERRGGGISKETWEAFSKDYIDVMPGATGKTEEQVGRAASLFIDKFNKVKTNKKVLAVLKDQLGIYANNSAKAEEFAACIEFLSNKADNLLTADDSKLLEAL